MLFTQQSKLYIVGQPASVLLNIMIIFIVNILYFVRFGQAGGFVKLRERFETIMGFQKTELTSSVTSEEKVSTEIIEKENEENKCDKVESTEIVPVIADSGEVCFSF